MEQSQTITLTKVLDFYNTYGLGGAGNHGTQSNHYFNRRERGEYIYEDLLGNHPYYRRERGGHI